LIINKKLKQEIKNYFNRHDDFIEELKKCLEKSKYNIHHINKCIEELNIDIKTILDDYYLSETIPEIKDMNMSLEIFISVLAKTSDIYTIGRLLKPYVKNAIIYMGADHGKNITKYLIDYFDFEIVDSYKDQGYPSWQTIGNIYGNTEDMYCIDINLEKLQFIDNLISMKMKSIIYEKKYNKYKDRYIKLLEQKRGINNSHTPVDINGT
jgi:hypothetical protein